MTFEKFKTLYQASFNKAFLGEGAWIQVVESLDESICSEALSILSEVFVLQKQQRGYAEPPGLKEIKMECWKVKKNRERSNLNLCGPLCRYCDGDSQLWIVILHQSRTNTFPYRKVLNPGRPEAFSGNALGIVSAPCPDKLPSRISYSGWKITTAYTKLREYIAICNAMYLKSINQPIPDNSEYKLPTINHVCPGCGAELALAGILPGLKSEYEKQLLSYLETIHCDNCVEKKYNGFNQVLTAYENPTKSKEIG